MSFFSNVEQKVSGMPPSQKSFKLTEIGKLNLEHNDVSGLELEVMRALARKEPSPCTTKQLCQATNEDERTIRDTLNECISARWVIRV